MCVYIKIKCIFYWRPVILHSSPPLALDTRIIIKEELICTQVRPIYLQVSIKKHELLLFSIEIFWQKREKPFNFIASRTLKYSLRSTFHFQPLCGRQDSWHLCMLLLRTMLFSFQICAARDSSIQSDCSHWCGPSYRPVQIGSAAPCQDATWQFVHMIPQQDQSFTMWQRFAAVLSKNPSEWH